MRHILRTILAFGAITYFISCGNDGGQTRPDGSITAEGLSDTLIISAEPREALTFTVSCQASWHLRASEAWIVATPTSAEYPHKDDRTVYISALVNDNDSEREGRVTLSSDTEELTFSVIQMPKGYESGISVQIREGDAEFGPQGGTLKLRIFSGSSWKAEYPGWLKASAERGAALQTADVEFTAERNADGLPRSGEIRIYDTKGRSSVLPVSQGYKAREDLIASWTVGNDAFMTRWDATHGNCWTSQGYIPADSPEGSSATARWNMGDDRSSARTYIISSDKAGHWAVKPTWMNDNMQFDFPAEELEKGDSLRFRAALQSNVGAVPADWTVEHLEGVQWIQDRQVNISAQKIPFPVETGYRITEPMTSTGIFSIRIRCSGTKSIDGSQLTKPQSGSALRFVPYPEGESSISLLRIRK